jgi:purine-cytosine permease-like protein
MDSDEVENDPPIVSVPESMRVQGGERHDDDELASAMEEQVSRMTSAIPIIAGPTVVGPAGVSDAAALTDEQVTALVDDDLSSHDTLTAIQHLEAVLIARAATSAIPVQAQPAPEPEPEPEPEREPEPEPTWSVEETPTQAISFDDLDLRPRRDPGPEPTFSAWIAPAATAAIPIVEAEPEPVGPPPYPSATIDTPGRAEPLGYVSEQLAPSESQPVPVLPYDLVPIARTDEPKVDSVPLRVVAADLEIDDVDDVDDVPLPVGAVGAPLTGARVGPSESVLFDADPVAAPLFVPEDSDLEPTPLDRRVGRASRMFWLWFAGTASLISVGVGATLSTLGLSLRQMLVATLIGVALSFLPLGIGTLAGKWSGQPTMVVSRATFGLRGNVVPAALALVTRLFWGAVLLWLAGAAVGAIFTSQGWSADAVIPTTIGLVLTIGAALAVAYFGYSLIARVQLVLTIASAALIVVMVAATWNSVHVSAALAVPDAVWLRTVTGAVLVFSYLGLAWANSSAEVARYQRPGSSGAASMLWATFGAALPPFILIGYGGLLAASNPFLARSLAADPVAAFAELGLPAWYPIPLLLAVTLSLVSGLVLTIYSGGFTLEALGVRAGRRWSTVAIGGVTAVAGFLLAARVSDLGSVLEALPTTLAVPVAAWVGLFASEMMLRTRRLHQPSLIERGGVYPDWRWTNLVMLVVASIIGLGLVSSDLPWLGWEGFLFPLLGVNAHGDLGMSNIGVVVSLALGLLTPIVSGIPAVRRQEQASA